MLEETYTKFKKYILPKQKRQNPGFQEPVIQSNTSDEVLDICSYNHYPVIEKETAGSTCDNFINDVYDMSKIEHQFEYGLFEDVVKSEQLIADLK